MPINSVTILWGSCGCGVAYYDPANPIVAPYVTFDSSKNVFDDNYKPYVAYDSDDKIYVPYNYETMQEATKLGEIAEILDISTIATILIIDNTGREYQSTAEDTALLLGGLMGLTDVVSGGSLSDNDTTYDNAWFGNKVVQEISTAGQSYIRSSDGTTATGNFTQAGNSITWIDGQIWSGGQPFRAKI